MCPETISHFYVGLRPPAPSPAAATTSSSSLPPSAFPESFPLDATGSAAAVAVLSEATAGTLSVPWLLLAMPLPPPVAGLDFPPPTDEEEDDDGGSDTKASTRGGVGTSSDRSPERSGEPRGDLFPSSDTGDEGAAAALGVAGHEGNRTASAAGGAEAAAAAAGIVANGDALSLRFVCHVETARLLATTAMGILGDDDGGDGGDEEGEEECARVLQAGEAFFAAFERLYCG